MSTDRKTSEAKKVEAARVSETSTSISHTNDKCITDFVMKGGSGMIIGTVFTVFFTRPRTYPIWFGMGIGMGLAYDCCQRRLANVDDNQQK
ncbi:MICOS complex subunit Mic10 [Drosophila obscura]|uniref:MICOS complex subunit Mic10 n=1 Tax=Drosophila obscura TaxID=7282 RepID=UPI000B9FC77B|nr:MICOS complex subunit Mic10 [Drosophila obscura]XP_022223896.1 MICOS complex subunit Mic10 [Drosophila obscura]XP_022223897.1 MICOS complex subunit Mic10 [Drosophila obscura]XP_022223898.1 MICOS complex subunit Mic10 [Drosophila obscura]